MHLELAALRLPMFGERLAVAGTRAGQRVRAGDTVTESLSDSPRRKRIVSGRRIAYGQKAGRRVVFEHLRRGVEDVHAPGPVTASSQRR